MVSRLMMSLKSFATWIANSLVGVSTSTYTETNNKRNHLKTTNKPDCETLRGAILV